MSNILSQTVSDLFYSRRDSINDSVRTINVEMTTSEFTRAKQDAEYNLDILQCIMNERNRIITGKLECLRTKLRAESISYDELHELQSLSSYIDPGDVELLEAAGVPESPRPTGGKND